MRSPYLPTCLKNEPSTQLHAPHRVGTRDPSEIRCSVDAIGSAPRHLIEQIEHVSTDLEPSPPADWEALGERQIGVVPGKPAQQVTRRIAVREHRGRRE